MPTGSINQENILYWSQQQVQVFERGLPNSNGKNRSQALTLGAALAAKLCENRACGITLCSPWVII